MTRGAIPIQPPPLCVDLEGTYLRSDLQGERLARALKRAVGGILGALVWLLRNFLGFTPAQTGPTALNLSLLPVSEGFVAWLREQRSGGRALFLCVPSNNADVEGIAELSGLFDGIIADDAGSAGGSDRVAALRSRFGDSEFDYAGNDVEDLKVWQACRHAFVVNPTRKLRRKLSQIGGEPRVFDAPHSGLAVWVRALRVHQWTKNMLIFAPALASHRIFEPDTLLASTAAFVCFSLCASGAYLINDICDLDADRAHPRKRERPLASGRIAPSSAVIAAPGLIASALGIAWLAVDGYFAGVVAFYLLVTTWYSSTLKRIAMVDVLTLGGLYSLRILAGSAATKIWPSFWLLALSMFLFFSLAIAKRYMELMLMKQAGRHEAAGRGYSIEDLPLLLGMGVGSGLLSVLVLALYITNASTGLYSKDYILWLVCPLLLYWICRIWLKTHRGQLNDDPVVFALTDRPSIICGIIIMLLAWAAT